MYFKWPQQNVATSKTSTRKSCTCMTYAWRCNGACAEVKLCCLDKSRHKRRHGKSAYRNKALSTRSLRSGWWWDITSSSSTWRRSSPDIVVLEGLVRSVLDLAGRYPRMLSLCRPPGKTYGVPLVLIVVSSLRQKKEVTTGHLAGLHLHQFICHVVGIVLLLLLYVLLFCCHLISYFLSNLIINMFYAMIHPDHSYLILLLLTAVYIH